MSGKKKKEFTVNEYISLKLERNKTNIYVGGELFNQCKYVLLRKIFYEIEDFLEDIDFGIVINKYDLNSPFQEEFKVYMDKTGFNILGKIPFDLSIPKAMSFAESVVKYAPDSKASLAIKDIYKKLKRILWNDKSLS